MDQKLVADILQAEVQVGRKIKQNQDNLRQFEEFSPDSAFESLKRFYINSYNLNQSASASNLTQSKLAGGALGSTYKGVVDLEKLTLIYRQYEESVSSFEIQAILQRHSAASDKGMDYDCFLKLIGYNISDTKRKNLIFDSVNKTERPISERCMKALSSIFLLELDLLRFTEVHKVSLVNNYSFDAATMFSKIDTQNSSQIDFEMVQGFFRVNGQEFTLQDFQVLLSRVKRGRLADQPVLTRQEFIQVVGPQLPYRGKNTQKSQVQNIQIGESKHPGFAQSQGRSVHFHDDYLRDDEQYNPNRLQKSNQYPSQSKELVSNQQEFGAQSKSLLDRSNSTAQFNMNSYHQHASEGQNVHLSSASNQIFGQGVPTPLQNQIITESQPIQQWYISPQPSLQQNQILVPTQQVQIQPQPIGQVVVSQAQEIYPQQAPIYQLGPAVPVRYTHQLPQNVVYQNTYIPPLQSTVVTENVAKEKIPNQVHTQVIQEQSEENSYSRSNRSNLALEAMNELLKRDNEKLKEENKTLFQQKLEAEQVNLRAREKELLRLEILEEQRIELKVLEEKQVAILKQQQEKLNIQTSTNSVKPVLQQPPTNQVRPTEQQPATNGQNITFQKQQVQQQIPISPSKVVNAKLNSPVRYVQQVVTAPLTTVKIPQTQTIATPVNAPILQQQPQVISYYHPQQIPTRQEFVPTYFAEQNPILTAKMSFQNQPALQEYQQNPQYLGLPPNGQYHSEQRGIYPPLPHQYQPQYEDYFRQDLPYSNNYFPYSY